MHIYISSYSIINKWIYIYIYSYIFIFNVYIYIYNIYIYYNIYNYTYYHDISPANFRSKARDAVAAAHGASSGSVDFGGADGGDHRRVAPFETHKAWAALKLEMQTLDGEMMVKWWQIVLNEFNVFFWGLLRLMCPYVSYVSHLRIWCLILFRLPGLHLDILHAKYWHGTQITPVSIRNNMLYSNILGFVLPQCQVQSRSSTWNKASWTTSWSILHLRCWLEVLQARKNLCQQLRSHREIFN